MNELSNKGLKSQHASAIEWLAKVTKADVDGLAVGSRTLEFRPTVPPTGLKDRKIQIVAGSQGASTLLIFQAVFPYLLYAGGNEEEGEEHIELEIQGSTNASFSPSYEYIDQVLLSTLQERFGIVVERKLVTRAWTVGPLGNGCVRFKFRPLPPEQTLQLVKPWSGKTELDRKIKRIDVSMLVPYAVRQPLERELSGLLVREFPEEEFEINFVLYEESGHDARLYVLTVAHSESGLRWGRDYLYHRSTKKKKPETLAREMAETVTKRLSHEVLASAAAVDEYLQDQLVVFQALAKGRSAYWSQESERWQDAELSPPSAGGIDIESRQDRQESPGTGARMRQDKAGKPLGFGSMHTTTARWVVSELMPTVKWFNNGTICEGAGISVQREMTLLSDISE
jgi:RNA 3'-terminal phosphate cyclase (ATP)